MYGEDYEFTYERPRMEYDKATGDVTILKTKEKEKRAIIKNYDDMEREKKLLYEELGMEGGDPHKAAQSNIEDTAEKLAKGHTILLEEYEIDPSEFNIFSRDMFRVDIGLIIQRPPIFMHMRDKDIEFVKMRSKLMNEYYCNLKERIAEFDEVSIMNESVLANNPYASQ